MKVLFFAISLLSLAPVFAQEPTTQESVPAQLKIMGRGIKNASNGEVVLMACVDEGLCQQLRLVKFSTGYQPQWLGNSFPISNTAQVREDLQKWYSASWVDGVLLFIAGRDTYSFTSTNGWNWANSPLELKKKRFDRVVSSVLYFAEYFHPEAPVLIPTPTPVPTPLPRPELAAGALISINGSIHYLVTFGGTFGFTEDDTNWNASWFTPLVEEFGGISVRSSVGLYTQSSRDYQVLNITFDGQFQIDDGRWLPYKDLRLAKRAPLTEYKINDSVFVKNQLGTITAISNNGQYQIDHTYWLAKSALHLVVPEFHSEGLALTMKAGDEVFVSCKTSTWMNCKDFASFSGKVLAVTQDGIVQVEKMGDCSKDWLWDRKCIRSYPVAFISNITRKN